MKIVWLGTDDTDRHNRQFHSLRLHMRDEYGAELIGPGYTMDLRPKEKFKLSEILPDDTDLFVWDDRGCRPLPVLIDRKPEFPCAFMEQDYHFKARWTGPKKLGAKWVLGSAPREKPPTGLDPWSQKKMHPKYDPWIEHESFRMMPYCVDPLVFYPGDEERTFDAGMYGTITAWYTPRKEAKRRIGAMDNTWVGPKKYSKHALYWDDLAARLRKTKVLWVDPPNCGMFVLKFHEGIACGCLLIGKRPYGWDEIYPHEYMIDCEPEDIEETVAFWASRDKEREEITMAAWEHFVEHHSIPARARQIMEVLRAS